MGKNEIIEYDDYAEIIIHSPKYGEFRTKIDLDDVKRCQEFKWGINKFGKFKKIYVVGASGKLLLHRYIMNVEKGLDVDHIHGDTLDNRKSQLRICDRKQNISNSKKYSTNKSGHKGVLWHKNTEKWMAYIMVNWKHKTLGYFDNIEDAIKAREKAEIKYFGEFRYID